MTAPDPQIQENQRQQRELYGQTLHDRLRAVMDTYGISQRRLAEVLGISAPMLSQLMSARRVKMGNPRSHERLVALEQRAAEHQAPGDAADQVVDALPAEVAAAITAEVAAQEISDTTHLRARHAADLTALSRQDLVQALRAQVGATELRAAQDLLAQHAAAPTLQGLLEDALD
jgi:transcriptional regulator with XRE-family HTH domain